MEHTALRRIHLGTRKPSNWVQLYKFGVVGVSGYAVNLIIFSILAHWLDLHHISAAVGAFAVAVTSNWICNRHWTFRATDQHARHQGARFVTVSLVGLAVNLLVLELLVGVGFAKLAAQALSVAVAMPVNFVANKLWTFNRGSRGRPPR